MRLDLSNRDIPVESICFYSMDLTSENGKIVFEVKISNGKTYKVKVNDETFGPETALEVPGQIAFGSMLVCFS